MCLLCKNNKFFENFLIFFVVYIINLFIFASSFMTQSALIINKQGKTTFKI